MLSVALHPSVHVLHKLIRDLILPDFHPSPRRPRWYFLLFRATFESQGHVSDGNIVYIFQCIFASNDDNSIKFIEMCITGQFFPSRYFCKR